MLWAPGRNEKVISQGTTDTERAGVLREESYQILSALRVSVVKT
jgi:hypothetical protein